MSTKLVRLAAITVFSLSISYPFHIAAQTAKETTPAGDEALPPKLAPGEARALTASGAMLKGRRLQPADAAHSRGKFAAEGEGAKAAKAAVAVTPQGAPAFPGDVGTGTGDIAINTSEINQVVYMPVNIEADIQFSGDEDFYAFPCYAGQQINVSPLATAIGSNLIADIALFESNGTEITESVGDGVNDPVIQFLPEQHETLVVGITSATGFGGNGYVYIMNIQAGNQLTLNSDPNVTPEGLPGLDATVFGSLLSSSDVNLFTFNAEAGQTLIAMGEDTVFGSTLVAQLTLSDPSNGQVYFTNSGEDNDATDPRFNIVLPYSGTYQIEISPVSGSPGDSYVLNLTTVPGKAGPGAPTAISATHTKPGIVQVKGKLVNKDTEVEVNSVARATAFIGQSTVNGHSSAGTGAVVTIANLPDKRRSNPIFIK
jgi:hypothetical protein